MTVKSYAYGPSCDLKGMALGVYVDTDQEWVKQSLDELQQLGVNAILLKVTEIQEDWQSVRIQPDPHLTISVRQLESAIQVARERGFRVGLMPVVLLRSPRSATDWRGMIEPRNVSLWFRSYRGFLAKYRRIARQKEVDFFSVGSEMVSLEKYGEEWTRLIRESREDFAGKLFYSFNWDHLSKSPAWSELDWLGVNAYYELASENETPSLERAKERWKSFQRPLQEWAQLLQKPLLFTEVGYPSRKQGLHDPWNHVRSGIPAPKVQAMGYRAFLETWNSALNLKGVFFYEWRGVGGESDLGYTPREKPALKILQKWMQPS